MLLCTCCRPAVTAAAALLAALLHMSLAAPPASGQSRIDGLRVIESSDAQLGVVVSYFYDGAFGAEGVLLHATPEEAGGVFDPRVVDFDEEPVIAGSKEARLTITKVPGARDFESVAVRVCMSTAEAAIVCRGFPLHKSWRAAAAEPHVPDPEPVEADVPPGKPRILAFSSSAGRVPAGGRLTLSWRTQDADVVLLGQPDPQGGPLLSQARTVPPSGSAELRPPATTVYVLQAERQRQVARREVMVEVVPSIELSFDVPDFVCADRRRITLSWRTRHATEVALNGRPVPAEGTRRIRDHRRPGPSTYSYTLFAANEFESVSARRDIPVIPADLCVPFED
jgi:hypothetical protein